MRKLFKSKKTYEDGHQDGYNKGWTDGFDIGSKKAIVEFRKVMVARIEKDIKKNPEYNKNTITGMNKAIELIRKIR